MYAPQRATVHDSDIAHQEILNERVSRSRQKGRLVAAEGLVFEELHPASLDSGSRSRFAFHSYQFVAAGFGLPPEPGFRPASARGNVDTFVVPVSV